MSPCESCHAGCCRSFAVPVTGADIIRIEKGLGLSFWDFACRWADPQGKIARSYAPHFHFADEQATPFVICLSHSDSAFLKGTTKCRFLMECAPDEDHPLGQARCGNYQHRPSACRAFPTKLNPTGELAIIYPVPERGRSGDPAYELCPREWTPADLDPIQTVQDLVVAKYEMDFFKQLATIWNRVPREWTLFPEFLHAVYAQRIIPEQVDEMQIEGDTPSTISIRLPTSDKATTIRRAA
ncbi:MAG: YkgJ family cysteine cluster protein [Planctomycetaceae bacterium]